MTISTATKTGAIVALVSMALGHLGASDLSWTRDPISTYAAHAPLSELITVSIWASALTIILVGLEASRLPNRIAAAVPFVAGASAAGLMLLSFFKETISKTISSAIPTLEQVRAQAFHDSGLLLFFFGSLAMLVLVGLVWVSIETDRRRWYGIGPIALALAAWLLPLWIPFAANAYGLKQRTSLFLIWLGLTIFAFIGPRSQREKTKRDRFSLG